LHLDEINHSDNQHHRPHTATLLENRFSDSIESLKSLSSEANSSFSSSLKMNNKHGNINLTGSSNKSLSRKSLTKLNNTCQENENLAPCNQQFHQLQQQQMSSSSSIINRKSNNSWIAQSFRKAFGKIENRRKNNQLNKSQVQLNKSLKAMSSTFSVNTNMNDYEYLSTGGSSQRNSSSSAKTNQISTSSNCSESGGSKRSSLSDDENVMPQSAYHYNARKQFLSNKLSLAPMSIHVTNNVETDHDHEDPQQNLMDMNENHHKYQKNALFAVAKRSYRSESELAKSVKHNVNNENQIKNNNCKNSNNYKADRNTYEPQATDRFSNGLPINLTTTTPTNTNNLNSKIPNSCAKLNKSVSSLLSGPNQNFEYNTQRIEEINQSHATNTNRVALQQQQIQRSKTPINNKILNSSNQILSNNPNLKW